MNRAMGVPAPTARLFAGEKWLVLTGLLGFVLAGVCAVWVLLYGGPVALEGDVAKAFSFNAALGLFLLSTAAVAPFSALAPRSRSFFRWSYIVLALYSYLAETVQHFRGVNPRFPKDGSMFDDAVGMGFAVVALLLVLLYAYFAASFFRAAAYRRHPQFILGIRYSMIAILLSFAAGVWISANQGRFVGLEGNIIWLHGLGFHALQVLPLAAWLMARRFGGRGWVHLSGLAFLLGLTAIGRQTMLGSSIFEWSLLPVVAACCFAVSLAPLAVTLAPGRSSAGVAS